MACQFDGWRTPAHWLRQREASRTPQYHSSPEKWAVEKIENRNFVSTWKSLSLVVDYILSNKYYNYSIAYFLRHIWSLFLLHWLTHFQILHNLAQSHFFFFFFSYHTRTIILLGFVLPIYLFLNLSRWCSLGWDNWLDKSNSIYLPVQHTVWRTESTFSRRFPWIPKASWLMSMRTLFCRMARASFLRVRRSLDMKSGAAMIAQRAIWERDCSRLRPKFPISNYRKKTQPTHTLTAQMHEPQLDTRKSQTQTHIQYTGKYT